MATLILEKPLPRGEELPYEDGEPLESDWHLAAMTLLIQILRYHGQAHPDWYVAGNLFVYFDPDQVKTRNFRGPDFFVIKGVERHHFRNAWVMWEEGNRTPDYVIELASASTIQFDLTGKKTVYEQDLKTPEYVVYDPASERLHGWRLNARGRYDELALDERGWLWSEQLQLWLGVTAHTFPPLPQPVKVLRFFDPEGKRLPTEAEAAEAKAEAAEAKAGAAEAKAEAEAHARRAAEAELALLKAKYEQHD